MTKSSDFIHMYKWSKLGSSELYVPYHIGLRNILVKSFELLM